MLIINESHILDIEQGYIHSQGSNVRHPIGINEIALLTYMIDHVGETLTKHELMHEVWLKRGIVVESSSLLHCISNCRRALEDRAGEIIRTVRGTGYEFVGRVEKYQPESNPEPAEAAAPEVVEVPASLAPAKETLGSRIAQYRTQLMAVGLFAFGAVSSYLIVEHSHSPLAYTSFEQQEFASCWFTPENNGAKVSYQNATLYDFGELTLLVDSKGRSLSFSAESGVVSCE
ncbi:winged helix-turn-helix domain-containing protein [Vibrio sp. Isolate25]|uniref:winged helix-turn-helix domain-containing protein n=1 Tax=Vibrio TaxID=662 RepID=UPI001EFD593D|nr:MULTISPECIES: winged helix-turn-helix domain-containing protein [Vibrio]MCG9597619.1 winged helix-turn-helix domain-containing protein [Vibrio sp. Isolate25]MCG9678773.1 winged helix-turn-helix domain-containing protein [Vibrio sp. Isolate24]USD31363.1 winged helix-turn-helix domain-containing protein [Vibrio sp. SCSIO 43186]USD44408.1 winged helix-turn-helix domain-containing protein [Vibrio sp. SCSIO 43145]USD68486.1 winged helix-turn-helix domain-containing protein [Vibrio sp. SCSIO 4313